MDIEKIISKLSLEEKASLCSGKGFWNTKTIERLGIAPIMVSDGPHGLRKQEAGEDNLGLGDSIKAVCFPTASCIASSFDREMIFDYGKSLGQQCQGENVNVILGPAVNIKRSPLCGRNFEYFSEDPYLTGEIAANYINGVQSQGVGTSIKHFAANNQEKRRMSVSSEVDERAFREIYLYSFEKAVKESQPWTVMCSYNKINGTYASENNRLLNQILRDEWGFDGLVVSDWGAVSDRVKGIESGLDLEMPSSGNYNTDKIVKAVKNGKLSEEKLNTAVRNVLNLVDKALENNKERQIFDRNHHLKKAIEYAEKSMVLLKNNGVLPLKKDKKIAFIGAFAKTPRYQGSGSSRINSFRTISALDAVKGIDNISYAQGYNTKEDKVDLKLENEALLCAKNADVAVIFAGLTDSFESEGFDRTTLEMPKCQNELIEKICKVQKNVVVVLHNGSPVSMPWLDNVSAVLECYLGGDGVGKAQTNILFGNTCPSGKIAETFPINLEDVSSSSNFPGNEKTVEYRESIYVGYRYFDKAKKNVLFPFGFGLSYTQFDYSDLKLSSKTQRRGKEIKVSFKIKNIGNYDGAEIAQIYVAPKNNKTFKAVKELKGFEKVYLKSGEEKEVTVTLDDRAFSHYDTNQNDWLMESGNYEILVASSSEDIRLSEKITVKGDDFEVIEVPQCYVDGDVSDVSREDFEKLLGRALPISEKPEGEKITIYDTLEDAKNTKWGRRIRSLILKVTSMMSNTSLGDGSMLACTVFETPITRYITMTEGKFTEEMAKSLANILNGDKTAKNVGIILKNIPAMVYKLLKK